MSAVCTRSRNLTDARSKLPSLRQSHDFSNTVITRPRQRHSAQFARQLIPLFLLVRHRTQAIAYATDLSEVAGLRRFLRWAMNVCFESFYASTVPDCCAVGSLRRDFPIPFDRDAMARPSGRGCLLLMLEDAASRVARCCVLAEVAGHGAVLTVRWSRREGCGGSNCLRRSTSLYDAFALPHSRCLSASATEVKLGTAVKDRALRRITVRLADYQ